MPDQITGEQMTTYPIPDEAVETAARAYIESGLPNVPRRAGRHYHAMHAALTAAAPLIAAQARAMPAENLRIVNGWLVERGAHDLDYPAGAVYGPYPDSDAEPLVKLDDLPGWPGETADLRAGIEALRGKWQDSEDEATDSARYDLCKAHAAALDALLRGAK